MRTLLVALLIGCTTDAGAELILSADRQTVFDTILQVNWLSNANLAGTSDGQPLLDDLHAAHPDDFVSSNGAMDFSTAHHWVHQLNAHGGYLGHTDWSLPTAPHVDATCSNVGRDGNSFKYQCIGNALGSLYYESLGLKYPNTAVPIPSMTTGPFVNFQPYLYWSATPRLNAGDWHTFSFNTGWTGSNIDDHYMYALPMVGGRLCTPTYCPTYVASGTGNLKVSTDGQVVYDPDYVDPITGQTGVTWLADANFALTRKFGAQCSEVDQETGQTIRCINADGSMSHATALDWIAGMNNYGVQGWLGTRDWRLADTDLNDWCGQGAPVAPDTNNLPSFNCTGGQMGHLFFSELGLTQGTPVVQTPNAFGNHLQPYLYWLCTESATVAHTCDENDDHAAPGFGWGFSFGNGFLGTDVVGNNLYVMVYYPQTTLERIIEAMTAAYSGYPLLLEAAINAVNLIANGLDTRDLRQAFIRAVNLQQRGGILTQSQADEIIALAHAL